MCILHYYLCRRLKGGGMEINMKLSELFNGDKTVFSLEVFPPKRDNPIETIYNTLDQLQDVQPDFISVRNSGIYIFVPVSYTHLRAHET